MRIAFFLFSGIYAESLTARHDRAKSVRFLSPDLGAIAVKAGEDFLRAGHGKIGT